MSDDNRLELVEFVVDLLMMHGTRHDKLEEAVRAISSEHVLIAVHPATGSTTSTHRVTDLLDLKRFASMSSTTYVTLKTTRLEELIEIDRFYKIGRECARFQEGEQEPTTPY